MNNFFEKPRQLKETISHKDYMKKMWTELDKKEQSKNQPSKETGFNKLINKTLKNENVNIPDFSKEIKIISGLIPGTDVTLELKSNLDLYFKEIETYSNIKLSTEQKELVNKYLENNKVVSLQPEERKVHRALFNKLRPKLRNEWAAKNNKPWPTYTETIFVNGKVARKPGQLYDAHHIIENSYGGPHVWWNLTPAAFPNEHQDGIHKDNSVASKIFGPINREFHTKPTDERNKYVSLDRDARKENILELAAKLSYEQSPNVMNSMYQQADKGLVDYLASKGTLI